MGAQAQVQQLHQDSMEHVLWDVTQASMAIRALSEMMREYTTNKDLSGEVLDHIDSGMWLCGELSVHQKRLIEQLESGLRGGIFPGGSESRSGKRKTLADSLAESATTVAPEGF